MKQMDKINKVKLNQYELIIARFLSVNGITGEKRIVSLLEQRPLFKGKELKNLLSGLKADGLMECTDGECWLTDTGASILRQAIQSRFKDVRIILEQQIMPQFKMLDTELKQTCLRWQVMPDGSPNIHEDSLYDFDILEKLSDIHHRLLKLINSNADVLHNCVDILADLNIAMGRIDNSEFDYVSSVNVNSYHNIWRELHEQLLNALGLERTE